MTSPPRRTSDRIHHPHGFFGRLGGVSEGPYAELNTSLSVGDHSAHVAENRQRVAHVLGAQRLLTARQVHSARAVLVETPFADENRPEADALVTRLPGIALGALAADCTPILLAGRDCIGAVHAGWRGSLGGVIASAVALMADQGAARDTLHAAIGPCLRRSHFEVRADLHTAVTAAFPDAARHFTPISEEQWLYDHTAFVKDRLIEAGIAPNHIDDIGGNTLGEQDQFFSYRGAQQAGLKQFGHNVSAIALPADL
ncbi:MAG: peptidoglycan editing factor PgeF [Pseudomonadota bacterium]